MTRPSHILGALTGALLTACAVFWQPGIHVVDGDTVDHGFWRWRLEGYDAPETGSRARCHEERVLGQSAKRRLAELLADGPAVLRPLAGFDRYGRRLARLEAGERDVAAVLIGEGLAREYHGGRRGGWCG
jgi:micrococcal nuclease